MDNSQILQEIDIIVRAKIEQAKKDINNVKKEVEKMAKTLTKEFSQIENSGKLDNLSKELKKSKQDIENFSDEVRKIKVTDDEGTRIFDYKKEKKQIQDIAEEIDKLKKVKVNVDDLSFSYNPKEENDYATQYNKALSDQPKQPEIEEQAKLTIQPEIDDTALKAYLDEVKNYANEQGDFKLDFNFSDTIFNRMAEKAALAKKELESINNVQINNPINKATDDIVLFKDKAISTVSDMVSNVEGKFSGIKEKVNSTLEPITNSLKNVGDVSKKAFNEAKEKVGSVADKISKPISKIKSLISHFKDARKNADNIKKSGSGIGDSLSKGIAKGINSIKKFALGLLSVRSAYTVLSRAASAYLSFDTQLSDSIQNSWNVLGSLLAPMLEYVASLFSKLVSVVATFVKTLTGVDLVARANSKALDKQTKSTKNAAAASGQLSSIDDISTLTTNSSGGEDSSPSISVQEMDTAPLDRFFEKAKSIFSKIFDPFKEAWNTQGKSVIDSAQKAFDNLLKLGTSIGKSLFEVWTNGTGTTIIENWLKGFQTIFDIIGGISSSLEEAWSKNDAGTTLIQAIADAYIGLQDVALTVFGSIDELINNGTFTETFSLLIGIFTDLFNIIGQIGEALTTAWNKGNTGTKIFQSIANVFNDILKFAKDIAGIILDWVMSEDFQAALDIVLGIIKDIFGWVEDISAWIMEMYEKYIKPVIVDKIIPAINDIIDAVGAVWNFVKPIIDKALDFLKKYLEPAIKGIGDLIGGLCDIIGGVAKFISGVFSGNWKKAWDGIKQIFKGVMDSIGAIVKTPINMIIAGFEFAANKIVDAFNWIKSMLNKLHIDIPSWLGGGSFGFNFKMTQQVKLPRLATGNVATEPTLALFGEYANAKSDPEITSPISMMKGAFRDVLHEIDLGGTRVDTLRIDVLGKNFFDDVIEYINEKTRRNGISVIKEV